MEFLSEQWCQRLEELTAGSKWGSADVDFEVQLAAGPTGACRVVLSMRDGVMSTCARDAKGSADVDNVNLKIKWDDAAAMLRGDLDATAAFMTGQIKTDGPTGPLLELLRSMKTAQADNVRQALRTETASA